MEKIYALIDGGVVAHAYFAGKDRDGDVSVSGDKLNTPAHTLENFLTRYLLPIAENVRLNQIIMVWDEGRDYRTSLFPEYKAKRDASKGEEFKAAFDRSREAVAGMLKALGVPQVSVAGTEADDVIAYLAHKLPGKVMLYTGDADLLSLSSDKVGVFYGINSALATDGWSPSVGIQVPFHRISLYKSLCGDASDEYGGVRGFGPAKWKQLSETYEDDGLQELQDAVERDDFAAVQAVVKASPGEHPLLEMLLKNLDAWRLGWNLARLRPELVGARHGNTFRRLKWVKRLPSERKIRDALVGYGCSHLQSALEQFMPKRWVLDASGWSDADLEEARTLFAGSPFVAVDWETWAPVHAPFEEASSNGNYVDALQSRVTGSGITFGRNLEYTLYASYDHADTANLPKSVMLDLISAIPDGKDIVAHNAGFERTVFLNEFDCDFDPPLVDTMILASHVEEEGDLGLKDLSLRWLGHRQIAYKEVIEPGKTMRDYSAAHVLDYAADDPLCTAHLYDLFHIITSIEGSAPFIQENEYDASTVFNDSYRNGWEIDWDELARQAAEDANTEALAEANIRALLQKHVTQEQIAAGVKNIWDNEGSVVFEATIAKDEKWSEEDVEKKRQEAIEKLTAACTYVPVERVEKKIEFKATPSSVNKVLTALGLPKFEGTSIGPKTIGKYLSDFEVVLAQGHDIQVPDPDMAQRFLDTLGAFAGYVKKPEAPQHTEFMALGQQLLLSATPEEDRFYTIGTELNFDSPTQMTHFLYGMLALPIRIRNLEVSESRASAGLKTGSPQGNEDAIRAAQAEDAPAGTWQREVLDALQLLRKAATRRKSFYSKYPLWKHPLTGRVHPQVNPVGTETRRPSGSNPNPFNLPKRGEGVKFRRCILPSKAHNHDLIVSIDWDQEELRLAAGLSKDLELSSCYIGSDVMDLLPPWATQAFGNAIAKWATEKTKDVHSLTGTGMANMAYPKFAGMDYRSFTGLLKDPAAEVQKEIENIRKDAKNVNFGSQYNIGPAKLSRKMLCTPERAKAFLDAKKALYWGYEVWRDQVVAAVRATGQVSTLYGCIRHLHTSILASDSWMVGHAERQAVNYLIQGLAADILKRVLREIRRAGIFQRTHAYLVAAIYDELVMSVHHRHAVDLVMSVHGIMTQHVPGIPVPLLAGPSLGVNFGDQIDIGTRPTPEKIEAAIEQALSGASKKAA